MTLPKIKIEYLNPTNIQSEVPREQPLRQNDSSKMTEETNMAENGAKTDTSSFVPVFTSKKEEAHFTKGDYKLQKVNYGPQSETTETIIGEVIDGPQPLRQDPDNITLKNDDDTRKNREDLDKNQEEQDHQTKEIKMNKSKIPKMRLKQAVEKVKRDRRGSGGYDEVPSHQQRRSSIPRRRRTSYKSPPPPKRNEENKQENDDSSQENDTSSNNIEENANIKQEEAEVLEEFDKIYDEIVHTDESLPFIDDSVKLLPNVDNLDDPISLEHSFEVMIHDYEENKVKPLDVKEIKTKIPLVKQKSLPEVKMPKKLERQSSLKNSPVDYVTKKENAKKQRRGKLDDMKKNYDKQQKEDLKEHRRLTKELLRREDEQNKDKQNKVNSKFWGDKNVKLEQTLEKKKFESISNAIADPKTNEKTSIDSNKNINEPQRHNQNDDKEETSKSSKNKCNESVKTTTSILEKDTYMPSESSRLVQMVTEEAKKKYEIKMDDGSPLLIENTLPAPVRHEKVHAPLENNLGTNNKNNEKRLENEYELNKEADERPQKIEKDVKTEIPTPQSRVKTSKKEYYEVKMDDGSPLLVENTLPATIRPQKRAEPVVNNLKRPENEENRLENATDKVEQPQEIEKDVKTETTISKSRLKIPRKEYHEVKMDDGSPFLVENTLPATIRPQKRAEPLVKNFKRSENEENRLENVADNVEQPQEIEKDVKTETTISKSRLKIPRKEYYEVKMDDGSPFLIENTLRASIRPQKRAEPLENNLKHSENEKNRLENEADNVERPQEIEKDVKTETPIPKLRLKIPRKEYHEVKMDDGSPFLIENTLPAPARHENRHETLGNNLETNHRNDEKHLKDELSKESDNVERPQEPEENVKDIRTETLIPTLRGKIPKLAGKFTSNDTNQTTTPPKKIEDIPKKKSILSKIALFSKDNDKKVIEKEIASEKIVINNNITNNHNNLDPTTTNKKVVSQSNLQHYAKDENFNEYDENKLNNASNFKRSESVPIEIPVNKFKMRPDTITPPNTPQISTTPDLAKDLKNKDTLNRIEEASERLTYENDKKQENHEKVHNIDENPESSKSVRQEPYLRQDDDNLDKGDIETELNQDLNERKPSLEATNEEFDDNDYILKGKVSKIINSLHSVEERTVPQPKKEVLDVPIRKSVSSRIAMFEKQPLSAQPNYKLKIEKKHEFNNKPRIIEEVLKTVPKSPLHGKENNNPQQINYNKENKEVDNVSDNSVVHQIVKHDTHVTELLTNIEAREEHLETNKKSEEIVDKTAVENITPTINKGERKISIEKLVTKSPRQVLKERKDSEDGKLHVQKDKIVSKIEERLKRIKSIENDSSQLVKPNIENNVGDAVQGKVHQILNRIKSIENLDTLVMKENQRQEKQKISERERPRKKSVLEKIALFEGKITAVEMSPSPILSSKAAVTPKDTTTSAAEYQERIDQLKVAKQRYGGAEMQYIELNNGVRIPAITLGTALLNPVLLPHIIAAAIDLGYRAFDTAYIYGNEREVGQAIRSKIADGTVKREDLFISGKLWSTFHRRDLVAEACRSSLEALGIDHFDLYMIHNPMSMKEGDAALPTIAGVLQYSEVADYLDAWYGMEDVYNMGLAKSIGVSNFNSEQIARVVEKGKITPVVNQVECHPYLTQERLEQFCLDRNITLYCFGSLGSSGTPRELKAHNEPVVKDPMVVEMAERLNISPARLLIRFQLECGHPVVTKCSSAAHLWDSMQALRVELGEADVQALRALNRNKRTYDFKGMGDTHRNYPFKKPF